MSDADDNAIESTPILAIALAVIAFLGVSTAFMPASWFAGSQTAETTTAVTDADQADNKAEGSVQAQAEVATHTHKPAAQRVSADEAKSVEAASTSEPAAKSAAKVDERNTAGQAGVGAAPMAQAGGTVQSASPSPVAKVVDDRNLAQSESDQKESATRQTPAAQQASGMNFTMPHPAMQWRPPHLSSHREEAGFATGAYPPARPGYPPPQPPYPPRPQPDHYGYGAYPMPLLPQPYMPGRMNQ